jgi:hypothetical protein
MAASWTFCARKAGGHLQLLTGCWIWASSMPARYVHGNIWHMAGRAYLGNQHNVSTEVTLLSSTVEQILTIGGELVVFVILLPFWGMLPTTTLLAPILLVPVGLIALHPKSIAMLLRFVSRILHRPCAAIPLSYSDMLILLGWYTLAALINGLAFLALANLLGIASRDNWTLLVGGYLLARTIGFLSLITPAGIGVREAALVAILASTVPMPLATMLALGARVFSTIAEGLSLGAFNIAFWHKHQPKTQSASLLEEP